MHKHRTEQIPVQEEKNKSRWSLPAALAAGALVLSACGAHEDAGAQNPNEVQHEADHSDEIKIVTDINYQFEHDFGPGELPWLTPKEVEALQENPDAAIRAVTEYVTYTLGESGEIGLDVANGDLEMSGDEIDDVLWGRTDGTLFNSLPTDNGDDEGIIADAGAAAFLTGLVSQEKTALCASDGFGEVTGVDCSSSDEDPYTVFGPDGTRLVLVTHSPEDDPGDYTTKRTEESENVIQIIDMDGEQHLKFAPVIEGVDTIVLSEGQSVGAETPEKPDQTDVDSPELVSSGSGSYETVLSAKQIEQYPDFTPKDIAIASLAPAMNNIMETMLAGGTISQDEHDQMFIAEHKFGLQSLDDTIEYIKLLYGNDAKEVIYVPPKHVWELLSEEQLSQRDREVYLGIEQGNEKPIENGFDVGIDRRGPSGTGDEEISIASVLPFLVKGSDGEYLAVAQNVTIASIGFKEGNNGEMHVFITDPAEDDDRLLHPGEDDEPFADDVVYMLDYEEWTRGL